MLEPMFYSLSVAQVQEESLQVIDGGWKSCPRSSTCTDVLQRCDTADTSKCAGGTDGIRKKDEVW